MKKIKNDPFFAVVDAIVALMLIVLVGFLAVAMMACFEKDDYENAFYLGGMTAMMVPITIIFIRSELF